MDFFWKPERLLRLMRILGEMPGHLKLWKRQYSGFLLMRRAAKVIDMQGLRHTGVSQKEVQFMNEYLKIPVDLCIYSFNHKLLKPFKLYVLLSALTQGNIILSSDDLKLIANMLKYKTDKSVKNNLRRLVEAGWVGYDPFSGRFWIRGFDELRKRLSLENRKAVEFGIEDMENFEVFCFSAIVGKLIIRQDWRRRSARMKSGSAFPDLPFKPGYFAMSNDYLSKVIYISPSRVSQYKKLAKERYLDIIPTQTTLPIRPSELATCKSNDPESYGGMYIRGGTVVKPGIDLVRYLQTYRRRKKIVI